MKRNSVRRAYQNIRPDEEARNRMLNNILLSSEISPAGKDDTVKRRKMKPMVIAAIIAAMVMLMGCGWLLFRYQDMKIGETTLGSYGEILDDEGNVLAQKELTADVMSLHGFINSPTYLAHQEWFEFYEEYSENHVITEEENFFIPPVKYEAYRAYNQELMGKIDEIAEKYDLKLLGAFAPFQRWESDVFYEATGLDGLLISGRLATIEDESGYFYEGGNFKVTFHMTMPDFDGNWPYDMLNTLYYSKTDYFDTVNSVIKAPQDWEQWSYTTTSGAELLIVREKARQTAKIFCSREDAIIYIGIDGYHEKADGDLVLMTKRQLEQVAEQFDYSLKVETVNMDIAKAKLEKFNNANYLQNESDEYANFDDFIRKRIEELGDAVSEQFYCLTDINKDGANDLIVGSQDEIDYVWMMKYGQMNRVMEYGENYKKLKEAWPDMEKKPITAYFSE